MKTNPPGDSASLYMAALAATPIYECGTRAVTQTGITRDENHRYLVVCVKCHKEKRRYEHLGQAVAYCTDTSASCCMNCGHRE